MKVHFAPVGLNAEVVEVQHAAKNYDRT